MGEGNAFTQPTVTIEDQFGNRVNSSASVTLGISSYTAGNGGSAPGSITGCAANPVTANGGVATFSGCAITGTGAAGTYVLKATSSGLVTAVASSTVTISSGSGSSAGFGQPQMAAPGGYGSSQLVFDDRFQGSTLDSTKWNTFLAGQGGRNWNDTNGLPSGWSATGSTGQTYYDPSAVDVNNGLSINMTYNNTYAAGGWHTRSGAISTFNKFTFNSGYVQVRAEMPDVSDGQWPAIWLLPNGTPTGGSEEIDMHEGGMQSGYGWPSGTSPNQYYAPNYHQPNNAQTISLAGDTPPSDLSTSFHTYGMELIAGKTIKFYLDGTLMATQSVNITNEPWELIMNLAEVASGVGLWHTPAPSNIATLPPSSMKVAEVQIYN